jgi:hypothetical protein
MQLALMLVVVMLVVEMQAVVAVMRGNETG